MSFDRRRLGDSGFVLISSALEEAGFLAAFSERTGGTSDPPYATLNASYSVGDDSARVAENRRRLIESLDVPPFAVGGQVHGDGLVRVGRERAESGYGGPGDVIPGTDGLYTGTPGVCLAVATADCAPIALASEREGLVAVIHAGWRGIAAGIVGRAAKLFEYPREAVAAIGPAAGACHYEVGEDVALAVASASPAGAVTERWNGGLFLDLSGTIRGMLLEAGVGKVEADGSCTIHERDRFFSHRRERETGRQLALVMRMFH